MKPTKNKIFCNNCGRPKMLFKTEKKALNFIKFNHEEIAAESGYRPHRAYYCYFCDGWHTTSIREKIGQSKNEYLFEKLQKARSVKLINSNKGKTELLLEERTEILNKRLAILPEAEIKAYFVENIQQLNADIEALCKADKKANEAKIKDLRYDLQVLYKVRKLKEWKK